MKRLNLDNHSPFHKTGHTSKGDQRKWKVGEQNGIRQIIWDMKVWQKFGQGGNEVELSGRHLLEKARMEV